MEQKTVYFAKPGGEENTKNTLALAKVRADELGIKTIIVATTEGKTGVKAVDVFKGYKVIVVTHAGGYAGPNTQELTPENRKAIEAGKGIIVTTTHALGGIQRALAPTMPPPISLAVGDVTAMALRMFGQGMKVCCEIAAMAADAGLVKVDEEAISIGGSGRGADTAVVLTPSYVHRFYQMKVHEIICKPRL
jgi:uncharacterized protein